MKKMNFLLVLLCAQLTLFGCTSQMVKTEGSKAKAQRITVVSSGKPADVLPAFTTYTWSKENSRVLSGVGDQSKEKLKGYISEEIKKYLSTKGYEYRENPKQADVIVGFLFALENSAADEKIQEKFGLLPGLATSGMKGTRYEKGSLLLAVFDNEEKETYWRSAVQGFVDLEKDSESAKRMQEILSMMLGGFPGAGK